MGITIRGSGDAISTVHEIVRDALDVGRDVLRLGGYGSSKDLSDELLAEIIPTGPASLRVAAASGLEWQPAFCRHLSWAIRYQCWRRGLSVATQVEEIPAESLRKSDRFVDLPFRLDISWGHKRSSLELGFERELDLGLVPNYHRVVAAWSHWTRCGAYFASMQPAIDDRDVDVGVFYDSPCVGHDFIEWSLLSVGVPAEAVDTVVSMLAVLETRERMITDVKIG